MSIASRRAFLLGAGASMALPFLPSLRGGRTSSLALGPATARADGAAPRRVVFWLAPWGVTPQHWEPLESNADGSVFRLNRLLEPLAPYQDRLTQLTGLNLISLFHQEGRSGEHTRGHANLFAHAGHHAEQPFGPPSDFTMPNGPSIDQVLAQHLGGATRFRSLQLGDGSEHLDAFTRGVDGSMPPMLTWPHELYDRVFRDVRGTDREREQVRLARRSMLDAVMPAYTDLRARIDTSDARVVDEHLTALRDLERRLGIGSACVAPGEPLRAGWDGASVTYPDPRGPYEPLLDLAVRALLCDQTRVMTVRFSGARAQPRAVVSRFDEIDPEQRDLDMHGYSHSHWNTPRGVEVWTEIQLWRTRLLARFIETLRTTIDVDGRPMLDNTTIVHVSEIMTGLHDTMPGQAWGYSNPEATDSPFRPKGIPVVVIGGCGDRLRLGRHLDFSRESPFGEGLGKYSMGELWLTIARAMGVGADVLPTFGDPRSCRGPIPELLVG